MKLFSAMPFDDCIPLESGINSKSRAELKEALAELLEGQSDRSYKRASLKTLLACLDCDLEVHEEPFAEAA